jgi:hypothetical protein
VTFLLLRHDNTHHRRTYREVVRTAQGMVLVASEMSHIEVAMKLFLGTILLLLVGTGCGGYGSGMGSNPASVPTISPASGTYATPLTVTISDSMANAVIYVTTDGTTPTLSSPLYRGPFSLTQPGQVTVRAIATAGGYATSAVASASYTLQ